MIKDFINGFCMALADSVPGVSGGTIAFIMGFYDKFIGGLNAFVFGKIRDKKKAFKYLFKLGAGWIFGMAIASVLLSKLFEQHIYGLCSLFIGFTVGTIPLIVSDEKEYFKNIKKGIIFFVLGFLVVFGISYLNGKIGNTYMDLSVFSIFSAIKLFLVGALAISAMFLPGISGSTILLIFGVYMPVITAIKGIISFDFSYIPCLLIFILGILIGAASVVRAIKYCLKNHRTQSVYMVIGMMFASFYPLVTGQQTLKVPLPNLNLSTFSIISFVSGIIIVFGTQLLRDRGAKNGNRI